MNGVDISNPLFYTEKYLQNQYVKANELSKHIHLFNHEISYIDYSYFYNLKGCITKISEIVKEKIYVEARLSEPIRLRSKIYYFNKELELYKLDNNEKGYQEILLFFDSLKKTKKLQITKFFDSVKSSQTDITFSDFFELDDIYTTNFYDNTIRNWTRPNQRVIRYYFKKNGEIHKTNLRNNGNEQSKTTIVFNNSCQILESKTFDQKNKTKLLYETVFTYENNRLKGIRYIRHSPTKSFRGNWTEELLFEYNDKGLLEFLNRNGDTQWQWIYDEKENPISIKTFDIEGHCVFERKKRYKYDKHNNWIYKEESFFSKNIKINETQINREIEYSTTQISLFTLLGSFKEHLELLIKGLLVR